MGKHVTRIEFVNKTPSIECILEKAEELGGCRILCNELGKMPDPSYCAYSICIEDLPKTKILLHFRGNVACELNGFFGQELVLYNLIERIFDQFGATFLSERMTVDSDYSLPIDKVALVEKAQKKSFIGNLFSKCRKK